ncbi:MAG: hypothetical protein Q7P63_11900 [Verrucomicrobiota bacterium JB022]|nr:hypothetical protein [Verrucomicrobiota bacterium JB022]
MPVLAHRPSVSEVCSKIKKLRTSEPIATETPAPEPPESVSLYVGNLAYGVQESEVKELFAGFGEISEVHFVMDKRRGRFRGFGFVHLSPPGNADQAIEALNGREFQGRRLIVKVSRQEDEE